MGVNGAERIDCIEKNETSRKRSLWNAGQHRCKESVGLGQNLSATDHVYGSSL